MELVRCECGREADLVKGDVIYPHRKDLHFKRYWMCKPCGAYVGCHNGSIQPFGTLADKELRVLRVKAHKAFDPMWKKTSMSRNNAYRWLSKKMRVCRTKCHISMFNVEQCNQVINLCKGLYL